METRITFRDRQEIQADDFNRLQTHADNSLAHLVTDAITTQRQVIGLNVTQKSATELEIAPGRLWDGSTGRIYALTEAQVVSVFSQVPLVDQKYIALSVIGQEQEADLQVRDFLIDLQSGQTQPETVPMEVRRIAVVHMEVGMESATPQKPSAPTNYTLIAHVLLGTNGILAIETGEVLTLPRLFESHATLQALLRWQRLADPRISTLASDVAGLAEAMKGLADMQMIRELAGDMARLKEFMNLPDTFSRYGADYFLDGDESELTHPNYYSRAEEGIRFPFDGLSEAVLELFNPYEKSVRNHTGFILPAYTEVTRLATTGYAGELALNQYQYETQETVQGTMTRERVRYGPTRTICTNAQEWRSGHYDPVTNVFRSANGDTWQVNPADVGMLGLPHYFMRQTQFWIDKYEEPYWYVEAVTHTLNGARVAQTMLNSQNGWLTSIGLYFTQVAKDGIVYLHICETKHGAPDPSHCIGSAQLTAAELKTYPNKTDFVFPQPIYLEAGKRYAAVLTTGGDHKIAIVAGENYTQGTLFYCLDGEYYQGDFTKDWMMEWGFAAFDNPRTTVELKPLQLAGGIADIDILAQTWVPPSTQLVYEYQHNGVWHPIADVTGENPLRGLPAMVPLRAVFIGSSDLMPGVGLAKSRTVVSRQAKTFRHLSTERDTPEPTTAIEIQARLEYFDPDKHALECKLLIDGALVTATETVIREEPGGLRKYFRFALATPTQRYRIQFEGTTTSVLDVFHVAHRIDIAS